MEEECHGLLLGSTRRGHPRSACTGKWLTIPGTVGERAPPRACPSLILRAPVSGAGVWSSCSVWRQTLTLQVGRLLPPSKVAGDIKALPVVRGANLGTDNHRSPAHHHLSLSFWHSLSLSYLSHLSPLCLSLSHLASLYHSLTLTLALFLSLSLSPLSSYCATTPPPPPAAFASI